MALPIDRPTLISWCKRKLGDPVIQINVSDDQCDDRVDEALQLFYDFHYEGTMKVYYKYCLTQNDIDNEYITLPDSIIGAIQIFPMSAIMSINNMFSFRYQIALNDLWDLTNESVVPFYQTMQHIQLLEELLVGQQPVRYNRHVGNFYIDMDWSFVAPGQYLIVEAYQIVDPEDFPKVWADRWLMEYTTALIKENWGSNLSKFQEVIMPGGMKFNGAQILESAREDIKRLRDELDDKYQLPSYTMIA